MSTTNEEASAETEEMETDELVIEIKKKIIPKSKSPNKANTRKEYDIKWEELPVFKPWLTSSKKSPTLAHCIACEKDLLGGKPELIKHGAAEKHRNNLVNIGWIKSDKSMKQKVYNCKLYSVEWEKVPEFKDWLTASKKDIYYAYCKACDKDLSAGKGELMKHSKVKKHLEAMKNFKPVDKKDRPIWSSDSEDDRKDFFLLKETLSENDDENSSSSSSSSESSCSEATSSPSPLPQTDNNSDEFPENTSNNENIEEIRDETINDDMFSLIFDEDSSSSISSLNSEENQNIIKSKKDPTSDTNFQEFNESLMEVEKPKTVKRSSKYVRKRPIDQPKKYPKKFVDMPEYKGWFMQSEKSKLYAYCRACKKDLSAGKSELKRHLEGNKHIQAANGEFFESLISINFF